jgi:hypothetical protein
MPIASSQVQRALVYFPVGRVGSWPRRRARPWRPSWRKGEAILLGHRLAIGVYTARFLLATPLSCVSARLCLAATSCPPDPFSLLCYLPLTGERQIRSCSFVLLQAALISPIRMTARSLISSILRMGKIAVTTPYQEDRKQTTRLGFV